MKKYILYTIVIILGIFAYISCDKDDKEIQINTETAFAAPPPCDSLKNVTWGDTLRVVPKTISTGRVSKGKFKGKPYWQAMLYSGNLIEPTKFQNDATKHRVVIADTLEITNSSIFIVARVK